MDTKPIAGLVILEGRDAGKIIPVAQLPFIMGRQPDSQLVLADDQVSRKHAQIENTPQGWALVDLKSRNGVIVDGRKIDRHILSSGDRLRVGNTVLMFHSDLSHARNVMSQSIPDSDAFAMEGGRGGEQENKNEEPTRAEFKVPIQPSPVRESTAIFQMLKLFTTPLSAKGCSNSIVDIFFQSFAPERAQIQWVSHEKLEVSRSRQEGRNSKPFVIPSELLTKAKSKPIQIQVNDRWVLLGALPKEGYLYADRLAIQGNFQGEEFEEFQTIMILVHGLVERVQTMEENKELKNFLSKMEKHVSPEVSRLIRSQNTSIEESDIGVSEKELTVLFCDIQGFTPLSEKLKPEQLAQLLNEYFQRMVDVISVNHGHLNKFIGDAIMALFGAPESHGNDAVNAVNAAVGMINELKRFWAEVSEEKRFHIRIGINTGKAVAGNMGSDIKMEYTVLGDMVNIASRLEGISPADQITIGPETARLVKDHFQLQEVPPVTVKGKSKPIPVFRVLGKK